MTKTILLAAAMALGGCAHQASAPSTAELTHAYQRAADSGSAAADAGRYRFCSTSHGVSARRTDAPDEWQGSHRSLIVENAVKDAFSVDPALSGQDIEVKAVKGEVWLIGHVGSDAIAARAAKDALDTDGVIGVKSRLTTPETPVLRSSLAANKSYCF